MTNNIPAFPLHNHGTQTLGMHLSGMTLRDYFAAKAMQGLLADPDTARNVQKARRKLDEAVADMAYMFADAMLKAREQ